MNKKYTLQSLLDEMKENISPFREGMIFETIKSIYPNSKVNNKNKNIIYEGKKFTKPLAVNKKAKVQFIKENSPVKNFYKEFTRGDFLQVVKINEGKAKCINLSLKEEIKDMFYKDELIEIDISMIIDGYIKQYKRKIDKFFN